MNVMGCYGFCRIPLNSIGLYASALPRFLELVWSSQGMLLSFVREVQRSFWLTNNFASLLRQDPFEEFTWYLRHYELFPHLPVATEAIPSPTWDLLSHSFYYYLPVVHVLAWLVSYTFSNKCSAKDSRRLTADLQSSLCMFLPPFLYAAQQILPTLTPNTDFCLFNSVRPLVPV